MNFGRDKEQEFLEENQDDLMLAMGATGIVNMNKPADAGVKLAKVYDQILEGFSDENKVDCKAGCAFCCHCRVELTHTELKMVERYIRMQFGKKQLDTVIAKAKKLRKAAHGVPRETRLKKMDPCVFLVEGQCSIYAARPLMCRSALSASAKACGEALKDLSKPVPFYTEVKMIAATIIGGIQVGEGKEELFILEDAILKVFK